MPRQVLTAPQGASVIPDLPNWAWHEYGMRVGFWRLKAALDRMALPPPWRSTARCPPPTVGSCRLPRRRVGVHGARLQPDGDTSGGGSAGDDPRGHCRAAGGGGHEPVGWLAPGLTETLETPDLLAEAGIRYCADWVIDDLPETIRTAHGPMLTMPYSVELNDIPMMMIQHHRAEELFDRTVAQFERLYEEAETKARKSWASPCIPTSVAYRTGSAGSSGARPHGGPARHAVLARAADHGLVSEGR